MDAAAISVQTDVASAGGGQAIENRPPFLGLRSCIALVGVFPSRD